MKIFKINQLYVCNESLQIEHINTIDLFWMSMI